MDSEAGLDTMSNFSEFNDDAVLVSAADDIGLYHNISMHYWTFTLNLLYLLFT